MRRRNLVVASLVVTAICWGFLGWTYVGSGVVARHHQSVASAQIREAVEESGNSTPATIEIAKGRVAPGVGLLSIPGAKVKDAPIVQGFDRAIFDRGLVGATGSRAGTIGNFVVGGHVVGRGSVFAHLDDLEADDKVTVKTGDGTYTYRIRAAGVKVAATVNWPLMPVPSSAIVPGGVPDLKPVITLITCASVFHTDTRLVVIGDLIKETK